MWFSFFRVRVCVSLFDATYFVTHRSYLNTLCFHQTEYQQSGGYGGGYQQQQSYGQPGGYGQPQAYYGAPQQQPAYYKKDKNDNIFYN